MIHKELIQGSNEWLMARLGKISASNIKPLMAARGLGEGAKTYALELIAEELTGEPKHLFINDAMQFGIDNEPLAREIYEQHLGEVVQVGGIEVDGLWYSPDGLVGDDGLIEIKCPQPTQHLRNLLGDGSGEYEGQIQFGLMVSDRSWCDFISFNPNFPDDKAFKITRVERDQEYISLLRERIEQFIIIKKMYNEKI